MKLAALKIPVTDAERAIAFYRVLFDSDPVFEAEEFGWVQFMLSDLPVALYVPGKGGGHGVPGHDLDFHLGAEALPEILARIVPQAPDAALHNNADGSQSLELTDPDGNALKIMAV
ncbi:hypothetical protein V8J82_19055 [Gymnodinialimonas sp. 2305UL16-5]|uniref:hypothetical protein n=1 Tax=Gymnodinialimonas mytili TaxID=3126503 RepID=UPI0030A4A64C